MLDFSDYLNTLILDCSSKQKIKELQTAMKKKDMISAKIYILFLVSNGRMVYSSEDNTFYVWMGNAWEPYDSKSGMEDLFLLLSQGILYCQIKGRSL